MKELKILIEDKERGIRMEYITDINIQEAIIHVLDSSGEEPILNNYTLELSEETYKFLYKHINKCLKSDELKQAKFTHERSFIKEITQDFLNGNEKNIIDVSKELARILFSIQKVNPNISSNDLIIISMITDLGPFISILKLDYVKNFNHQIEFVDNHVAVGLKNLLTLPSTGQKVDKAAFIRLYKQENKYDLFILDKRGRVTNEDDVYGANYWSNSFLDCSIVTNDRENTKRFLNGVENFVRRTYCDDAIRAEEIRTKAKEKVIEDDILNIEEIAEEIIGQPGEKENFKMLMLSQCDEEFKVDKEYAEKKLKRIRLKIDRDIDLYIHTEAYKDPSKFQIQRNGDGSINMIIKNVINYIEK